MIYRKLFLNMSIFKKEMLLPTKKYRKIYKDIKLNMYIDYFRFTFCSNLMRNTDINVWKFMCVGVEFLACNVLVHTRSEQKIIGN